MSEGRCYPQPGAPLGSGTTPNHAELRQWATELQLAYYSQVETVNARNPQQGRLLIAGGEGRKPGPFVVNCSVLEFAHAFEPGQPCSTKGRIRANGVPTSQLQVELQFSTGAMVDPRYPLDVGAGWAWSFFGGAPKVFLLLPEGGLVVASPSTLQPAPGPGDGALNEALLTLSIQETDNWQSRSLYQQTQSRLVEESTVGVFPVPYGAQYVEVHQDPAGAPSLPLQWWTDSAAVADLAFLAGLRRTGRQRIPGHARAIRTNPTQAQDRLLTAIFEMEP